MRRGQRRPDGSSRGPAAPGAGRGGRRRPTRWLARRADGPVPAGAMARRRVGQNPAPDGRHADAPHPAPWPRGPRVRAEPVPTRRRAAGPAPAGTVARRRVGQNPAPDGWHTDAPHPAPRPRGPRVRAEPVPTRRRTAGPAPAGTMARRRVGRDPAPDGRHAGDHDAGPPPRGRRGRGDPVPVGWQGHRCRLASCRDGSPLGPWVVLQHRHAYVNLHQRHTLVARAEAQRGGDGLDLTPGPFPEGKGRLGGAGPPLPAGEAGAVWRGVRNGPGLRPPPQ